MRKIVVLSFISLDGVMQAPGGPEEDTSGGFKYGGWTFPYFDEFSGKIMSEQMGMPFDLLLGRKTYDIFAAYWPKQDPSNMPTVPFNNATKYVVSGSSPELTWENSVLIEGGCCIKAQRTETTGMGQCCKCTEAVILFKLYSKMTSSMSSGSRLSL